MTEISTHTPTSPTTPPAASKPSAQTGTTPTAQTKNVVLIFKETFEQLVIAFILAFVFRAFVVEAFVIPTGSMADTLRGAHFSITCPTCGMGYNYGFVPEMYQDPLTNRAYPKQFVPMYPIPLTPDRSRLRTHQTPICPVCGGPADTEHYHRVKNGDRILVLKYLYQFTEPKIWDVVVFKNPTDPVDHFIKRLIGTPGDLVEILDGDVYINGQIQRKPDAVQEVLWIKCLDYDYQPHVTYDSSSDGAIWENPFTFPNKPAGWTIDASAHQLEFTGSQESANIEINPTRLKKIMQSFLAYNGPHFDVLSIASDLKIECILTPWEMPGRFSITLSKYQRPYRLDLDFNGQCTLTDEYHQTILAQTQYRPLTPGRPVQVSFANVDHRLWFALGNQRRISFDGPNLPEEWGYDPQAPYKSIPAVVFSGQGRGFRLSHMVLYRDIHYTDYIGNGNPGRATALNPIAPLGPDEFFVLGDNSPSSNDSRFWTGPGIGNHGQTYRPGIVPRDYLIGRAFFVYWPAGFHPNPHFKVACIPNLGQMRFIR